MELKQQLKGMSADERKALLAELQAEENNERVQRREAYEALRHEFMSEVRTNALNVADLVGKFYDWLSDEADGFRAVMEDYGQIRRKGQANFTVKDDDFKLEVTHNKIKRFDERGDIASSRLMEYLARYLPTTEKGVDDELYQLCMTLLERNRKGDLDYKNISKLYSMEDQFGEEYHAIMNLFREAHVVEGTRTNYYFKKRDERGVWHTVEVSFNRL